MKDGMYDEITLEREIKAFFGIDVDIKQMIIFNVPVSPTARASVVLNTKKQLFLFIKAQSRLTLGDVRKMANKMNLKPALYIPPKGKSHYFEDTSLAKFHEVFPGRKNVNDEDLIYYRTLVPYNPALVVISEVKDGKIYQFDSDSNTSWRLSTNFSYRRIKAI